MNLRDYHRHQAIGSTLIKTIARDGAQIARHQMLVGGIEPPSRALVLGAALHKAIEGREEFCKEYAIAPESYKTGDSQKFADWSAQVEANENKIGLTQREADNVWGMADAIRNWYGGQLGMHHVESERSIFWRESSGIIDPNTGEPMQLECKCRPDLLLTNKYTNETRYDEIKTAADVSERGFRAACSRYGYPLQQAHYGAGLRAEFPGQWIPIRFVLVRSSAPHIVRYYEIDSMTELEASRQRKLWLTEIARRTISGDWHDEGPTRAKVVECGWRLPDDDGDEQTEGE